MRREPDRLQGQRAGDGHESSFCATMILIRVRPRTKLENAEGNVNREEKFEKSPLLQDAQAPSEHVRR
jgi:hypothetical protein